MNPRPAFAFAALTFRRPQAYSLFLRLLSPLTDMQLLWKPSELISTRPVRPLSSGWKTERCRCTGADGV